MAVLISAANGNLTDLLTVFDIVSTGTGAIAQTVTTKTSYTTTTYTYGTAFTGTNLDVVDGVLMHMRRNGVLGLLDVALSEDNGTTATRSVQVNISDIPSNYAWVFFKFGSSLTLDGGTDYKVGIKTTSSGGNSGVTVGNSGSNNWAHILRKVSLATAAAGDVIYIVGEHTGAGATTTRTITMDQTVTTDYGTGSDGQIDNGLEIGDAGVLTFGTTGATNYYLKLSGSLGVWANGTLNIGTIGTPMPRNSSAVLEFDPVADNGMGLMAYDGCIINMQGLSRTAAKLIDRCKLNTDEAANSTSLGVDTDTGWLDNDEIAVFSTTRTGSQTEKGTMNGAAGASDLTVDGFAGTAGGILNAHSGTSPTQAEVILLTRNIKVRSATSTIASFCFPGIAATMDIDWVEFVYLGGGSGGIASAFVISSGTEVGSISIRFSSFHDSEGGILKTQSTAGNGVEFSNNVSFNMNTGASTQAAIQIAATTGVYVIDTNCLHYVVSNNNAVALLSDVGLTFTNNTIVYQGGNTSSIGIALSEAATIGTFSGNTVHSSTGIGISPNAAGIKGTLTNTTAWRNGDSGLRVQSTPLRLFYSTLTMFGNTNENFRNNAGTNFTVIKAATLNSDASFSTANGMTAGGSGTLYVFDSSFGATTAHTLDIFLPTTGGWQAYLFNTTLASSTEVSVQTTLPEMSFVRSHKHDASSTTFKDFYRYGTIQSDTTTRHTASGYSWKLTPNNATNKLILPGPTDFDTFKVALASGVAVTISAYLYKDGTYNGNQPRLVVVGGIVTSVGSAGTDLTASMAGGLSAWEQVSVAVTPGEDGVVECYIDCDGTAGNVYVDDFAVV